MESNSGKRRSDFFARFFSSFSFGGRPKVHSTFIPWIFLAGRLGKAYRIDVFRPASTNVMFSFLISKVLADNFDHICAWDCVWRSDGIPYALLTAVTCFLAD